MANFPKENPRLMHAFPLAIPQTTQNIDRTVVIMLWNDSKYLALMHQTNHIEVGMMVYYEFGERQGYHFVKGSYLNWMSKQWCQIYPIRDALGRSEGLKWLLKGTEWDINMLASVEINDATVPRDYMEDFSDRIVALLKEVEKWDEADEE